MVLAVDDQGMVGLVLFDDEASSVQSEGLQKLGWLMTSALFHNILLSVRPYTKQRFISKRYFPRSRLISFRITRMSENPIFVLTPKEDLILLTIKYNNPCYSWEQVSQHIFRQHLLLIPSDVCRERFNHFLSIINQQSIDVAQHWTRAQQWLHPILQQKIPENFIFAYKDIRNKAAEEKEDTVKLACLERHERKVVSRLLGFSSNHKAKMINKHKQEHLRSYTNSELSIRQDNTSELVHNVYDLIKQRCEPNGILNEQIAEQKIELILSQILQATNEKIAAAQCKSDEHITNGLDLIRLMRKYRLGNQRRDIFEAYFQAMQVNSDNYPTIKAIFKFIHDNYFLPEQEKRSTHTDETTQESEQSNSPKELTQSSCSKDSIYQQDAINSDEPSPCHFQSQSEKNPSSLSKSTRRQSHIQSVFNQNGPDRSQSHTASKSTCNSPQSSMQQNQTQKPQNIMENKTSNFQIVISKKVASICIKATPQKLQPALQVKQQAFQSEEGTVKQEDITEVKYQEPEKRKRKTWKRRKVPKKLGKVWIILND